MRSKKQWSPGSDVPVQSVERNDAGGWLVSGTSRHLLILWIAFTATSRMAGTVPAGFFRTWRSDRSGTLGLPPAMWDFCLPASDLFIPYPLDCASICTSICTSHLACR